MYRFYLTEEDLLKVEQFPMVALINEAANSDIIEFEENLVNGVGSGYNYSNCSFWDDWTNMTRTILPNLMVYGSTMKVVKKSSFRLTMFLITSKRCILALLMKNMTSCTN